jgi:GDP-D-mannose 3',5'-epimerase
MNQMMNTISTFDKKELPIRHIPGPEGVRGRNSDNSLILEKLGWEPTIRLEDGLRLTYGWIKKQLEQVCFHQNRDSLIIFALVF